jgi:hypothetical protein
MFPLIRSKWDCLLLNVMRQRELGEYVRQLACLGWLELMGCLFLAQEWQLRPEDKQEA